MDPYKKHDLKKFLDSIPPEEAKKQMELQEKINREEYTKFIEAFSNNKCYLCNNDLDTFIQDKPCLHWFLYPKGIRKKYFETFFENPVSFFGLDIYLRWVANTEKIIGNINDSTKDKSNTSLIETTIKYKNIEWAFSIGNTDIEGHKGKFLGEHPHYHILMKVNGNIFIAFNDFHIKFTDEDLFNFELIKQTQIPVHRFMGEGIGLLEDKNIAEMLLNNTTLSDDPEIGTFETSTIIMAPEGETLSGEFIFQLMEESEKTKTPIGQLVKKYKPNAPIVTDINPGKNVPKMIKRSGKK